MIHEFKLGDTAWWFSNSKQRIALHSSTITSISRRYVMLKRRTFLSFGWSSDMDIDDVFPSKEIAINSMIAKLEKLRDE